MPMSDWQAKQRCKELYTIAVLVLLVLSSCGIENPSGSSGGKQLMTTNAAGASRRTSSGWGQTLSKSAGRSSTGLSLIGLE